MTAAATDGGVLLAGLPDDVARAVSARLGPYGVEVVASGSDALAALARGGHAALVVDGALERPPAEQVLRQAREELRLTGLPVVCCLDQARDRGRATTLVEGLGANRIVFHPLDPDELSREVAELLGRTLRPPDAARRATDAVAAILARHRSSLVARVAVLEGLVMDLLEGGAGGERREEARREAHKLAGSLGTFGFEQGSRLAREFEHIVDVEGALGPEQVRRLAELALGLQEEVSRKPAEGADPAAAAAAEHDGLVLVVDADGDLTDQIILQAAAHGMRATAVATTAEARGVMAGARPDVVVVDLGPAGDQGDACGLMSELAARSPPVPVLALGSADTFTDRVEVARLGGRGFLQKPLPAARVVDAVAAVLDRARAAETRVLAVDDDPTVLAAVSALLGGRGLRVTTLAEPLRFWEALEEADPEVVLLDVDMPEVSGVELCRVLRNDPRWAATPVLVLTARVDAETVQRVFAAGADDFIAKPLVGPELVTRIENRLERARLLTRMGEIDPLTGVPARAKATQDLAHLLRLADGFREGVAVAVLEVDLLAVDQRHGRAAGDRVLRRLGGLLRQAFRGEDVIGRWDGPEFLVAMHGLGRGDAIRRMDELGARLRRDLAGEDEALRDVTLTGGVALYPADGRDPLALHRAASAARDMARAAGGGRFHPVGGRPDGAVAEVNVDIALVEDDEALAELLRHGLETRGYSVHWVADGDEAAAALAAPDGGVTARLVLLDWDLPGLNGLGVLRRMADGGVLRHTRVIMLTARAAEAEVVEALTLGAFDHVAKPFSVPVLLQRIGRALEG